MTKKQAKNEIVRVRLSSPFMVRATCKYCGGSPFIYYYIRNPSTWLSARKNVNQMDFLKNLIYHLMVIHKFAEPKDYNCISHLSFGVGYTQYRPRLHRTKGSSGTFDIVEFLTCNCMKTTWAFNQKSTKNRPEITNRKARFTYPRRFDF